MDAYRSDANGMLYPVDCSDPDFQKVFGSGVYVEVDLPVGDRGMTAGGTVRGRVDRGKLSFAASLELLDDVTHSSGPVSATLEAGSRASIVVRAGKFRGATLGEATAELGVDLAGDTLELAGRVEGKIGRDYQIRIDASLTILEDFVYEKGPVSATLAPGGSADVQVGRGRSMRLGLRNADIELLLQVPGTNGLKLQGSLKAGQYKADTLKFSGTLELAEPFYYERKGVKARLDRGTVRVHLHDGARHGRLVVFQPGNAPLALDLDTDDGTDDDTDQ